MSKVLMVIKEFSLSGRKSFLLKWGILLVITAAITAGLFVTSYSDQVNKGLAENLIRLHVIANSDTEEDQALKRSVRDKVIAYMKEQLKDSKDIEQTQAIINQNIDKIQALAKKEIASQNKDYPVKVLLGSYPFPTKTYGDIALPAGNYQALRIVIGQGEGANWWCVLFPPLCFVDATHGTVPDSVKQDLRNVLTEEEYRLIAAAESDEDIPIKVKFKVVEFFEDSKIKFNGMISRLFKVK